MKIALNLSREYLGGITSTSINTIKHLSGEGCTFVGIEMNARLSSRAPEFYSMFEPQTVLDQRIIQTYHLPLKKILKKAKSLEEVRKYFKETIELTREILKDTKPDIILISGTYYIPWIISIAAKKEKIPVVLRYAGILSQETSHYPERVRKVFLEMEKSIVRMASQIIFPSKICRNVVEDTVLKKKIRRANIIPNEVSELFSRSNFEKSSERKIATVGRYDRIKNIDDFIELHKILLKEGWPHEATLVTNKLDIPSVPKTLSVELPMNRENLREFYRNQGLIICPSKFETFGNVPMEAACIGIPVLVSDKMGCADILKEAQLGNMIMSFDDLPKVAERVKQLCGQYILPKHRSMLRDLLDPYSVNQKIYKILQKTVANG